MENLVKVGQVVIVDQVGVILKVVATVLQQVHSEELLADFKIQIIPIEFQQSVNRQHLVLNEYRQKDSGSYQTQPNESHC